jgi:osomolarity two-component system sensor histidine kinase TcsA
MERCMEKGMDDYIAKPMNRQLLMKKLLKWLVRPADTVLATTAREQQKVPPYQHSTSQQQS